MILASKILDWILGTNKTRKPVYIPRSEHSISRSNISKNALKVLYRLHKNGYQSYLVGGCLRDLLLERDPKDFDLVTSAHPEDIKKLFKNCRLIGRRFRLAHIHFGREIIEVATFRSFSPATKQKTQDGMILRDNIYGTIEEDVMRRDLTINALYYNIADFSLVDYVGGLDDLKNKQINLIGDPATRYREDPVRMLRAIRFAAKLQFTIYCDAGQPIYELNYLLGNVPAARLFEEYTKLFLLGHALATFELLKTYNIVVILFPQLKDFLENAFASKLIKLALANTDQRFYADLPIVPSFLIAVFLWAPLLEQINTLQQNGIEQIDALPEAMYSVLKSQQKVISFPKRLVLFVKEIWQLQFSLQRRSGKKAAQLFALARFRAAYDFLLLRAESGDKEASILARWWTKYINANEDDRKIMAKKVKSKSKRKQK